MSKFYQKRCLQAKISLGRHIFGFPRTEVCGISRCVITRTFFWPGRSAWIFLRVSLSVERLGKIFCLSLPAHRKVSNQRSIFAVRHYPEFCYTKSGAHTRRAPPALGVISQLTHIIFENLIFLFGPERILTREPAEKVDFWPKSLRTAPWRTIGGV